MAGAKLSALTEIIERDSAGTTPFDRSLCFEIETEDQRQSALLDSYRHNPSGRRPSGRAGDRAGHGNPG